MRAEAIERRLGWVLGGAVAVAWAVFELVGPSRAAPTECGCEDTLADPQPERRTSPTERVPSRTRHALADEDLDDQLATLETTNALLAERNVTGELGFYNLTPAELEAMARHCDVRTDYPKNLEPTEFEDLGMTEAEQQAWQAALQTFADRELALYGQLLAEIEPNLAEPVESLADVRRRLTKVAGRGRTEQDADLRRVIAEERAGLRDAPEDPSELSTWNRYTRLQADAGDRFAAILIDELGAERVHELRSVFDGWPGARTRQWGCD